MSQQLLFNSVSVFDVIENQKRRLRDELHELPVFRLDDADLPERLAAEFGMNVPVLDEDKRYAKKRPTQIDVSRDPMRRFFADSGPHYEHGTELSILVPFSGDPAVFNVRPSTFDANPPRGEALGNELCLTYTFVNNVSLDDYQRTIASVKKYLDWLRPSASQLRVELEQQSRNMIAQRKKQEAEHAQALETLGIPILDDQVSNPLPAAPAHAVRPSPMTRRTDSARKASHADWDVFISHATEDKDDIARPLANELRAKGLSVWYDEFSLKLGGSLRQSIDLGLSRSKFGAVILSPHFFEKHWPQQELNGLATREVGGKKVILPVWHKVDFEQVRQYSPMLADRIAVSTKEGLEKVVQKIIEAVG